MKKFRPLKRKRILPGTELKDPEPYLIMFQGEETDLHDVLLFYMKDSLQAAITELAEVKKKWNKHPLSPDSVFGISIDVLENLKNTLRFAELVPPNKKASIQTKLAENPINQLTK